MFITLLFFALFSNMLNFTRSKYILYKLKNPEIDMFNKQQSYNN